MRPDRSRPAIDVTPAVPRGRQIVQSYRGGRFRIAGRVYRGSVLVYPETTKPWPVASIGALTRESLADVVANPVDVLLIGAGAEAAFLDPGLRAALRAAGIVADAMATGAACRTFNVLAAEDRNVAAALIATDE